MAFQHLQDANEDDTSSLVLSCDAKPRLKWTSQLHQRFVDAVHQLGGPDKATPKSLMRLMGIHGLTLYHLKSHLQKFRLGKSQESQAYNNLDRQEDYHGSHLSPDICDGAPNQINPSLQITQALQMQMEVQRKLHQQIEVQRHLQLRIEAQGKYLQTVLQKAQETVCRYNSCPGEMEVARAELSQLVSLVEAGCSSSSLSVLTDLEGSLSKDTETNKPLRGTGCSVESPMTSCERSEENKEEGAEKHATGLLQLMEMNPGRQQNGSNSEEISGRKRSRNSGSGTGDDENSVEKHLRKYSFLETIDLNTKCGLDLNCGEVQLFDA